MHCSSEDKEHKALVMKTPDQKIEHILQRMLADRSTDAPADSITWAKNLYRTRAAQQPASLIKRIMAVVTADLAPGRPAFGERSGGAGQARQVLFEAGDNAVDLRIKATKGGFDLHGQVLGEGYENAVVELAAGDTKLTASADQMAMFSLSGIPAGDYDLTIKVDAGEIVIEQLTLK